jgi:hypothetical protein
MKEHVPRDAEALTAKPTYRFRDASRYSLVPNNLREEARNASVSFPYTPRHCCSREYPVVTTVGAGMFYIFSFHKNDISLYEYVRG